MITKQHWKVFQLVNQERKGFRFTSEIMEISIERAKELLAEMRKIEPGLFPVPTERFNLGAQIPPKERKRLNMDIVSFDARQQITEDIESEIVHKF